MTNDIWYDQANEKQKGVAISRLPEWDPDVIRAGYRDHKLLCRIEEVLLAHDRALEQVEVNYQCVQQKNERIMELEKKLIMVADGHNILEMELRKVYTERDQLKNELARLEKEADLDMDTIIDGVEKRMSKTEALNRVTAERDQLRAQVEELDKGFAEKHQELNDSIDNAHYWMTEHSKLKVQLAAAGGKELL